MTASTLAERLRGRRDDLGASIDQAARWSGLSPQRLREIEGGSTPSVTELDAACRGLGVSASALFEGATEDPRRSVARFRGVAPSGGLSPGDLRLLSVAAEVGRHLGGLLKILGRRQDLSAFRQPIGVSNRAQPWEQGYELGESVRQRLQVPDGPIENLTRLFLEHDIHVVDVTFSRPEIEGASLWEPDSVPVILVNEAAGRATYAPSRRAILAHELCHLLHDGGEGDLETRVSYSALEDPVEQRARAFAPAFLAPRAQLLARLDTASTADPRQLVEDLARTWGLSFRGAAWHAQNCRLIPAHEVEQLVAEGPRGLDMLETRFETSSNAEPSDLPVPASPLMKGLGSRLVQAALVGEEITLCRARELLTWC